MKLVATAFLAAVLAAPALAADPQPQQGGGADKPKKPRLICKAHDRSSSRISRNVCKTAEGWAATAADDHQDRMDTMGRSPAAGSGFPAGPQ